MDVLSVILEALGPQASRAVQPVCKMLRTAVADKLVEWRAQGKLMGTIDFCDLDYPSPSTNVFFALWHPQDILQRYVTQGIGLSGNAVGVIPGMSEGDIGNWQLEGTRRGVPGGGRYLGFNAAAQSITMHLMCPCSAVVFDLVTRDAKCAVGFLATDPTGAVLHEHAHEIGPKSSSWLSPATFGHDTCAFRARAMETTHCTTVRLVREGVAACSDAGGARRGECRKVVHQVVSETADELVLTMRPGDEIATVTFTMHDRNGGAVGLSNLKAFV